MSLVKEKKVLNLWKYNMSECCAKVTNNALKKEEMLYQYERSTVYCQNSFYVIKLINKGELEVLMKSQLLQ